MSELFDIMKLFKTEVEKKKYFDSIKFVISDDKLSRFKKLYPNDFGLSEYKLLKIKPNFNQFTNISDGIRWLIKYNECEVVDFEGHFHVEDLVLLIFNRWHQMIVHDDEEILHGKNIESLIYENHLLPKCLASIVSLYSYQHNF